MEQFLINKSTLTNLADIVREKSNSEKSLTLNALADKMSNLPVISQGITWDEFNDEGWVIKATLYSNSTKIPDDTFAGTQDTYGYYGPYSRMEELTLPPQITQIGAYAFQHCKGLTSFDFSNIESIGNGAFLGCSNLELNEFPSKVTWVSRKMFEGCDKVSFTNFPEGSTPDTHACTKMTGLVNINIPSSWTTITTCCFSNCTNLTTINLPNTIKAINNEAFLSDTKLQFSKLPEELETIGQRVFWNCYGLTITEIPANVTTIGVNAFYGCTGITNITFKGTPTSLATSVFAKCNNLTTINVPWAEGAVANAPWGATQATINYNYVAPTEEE